MAARDAQLHEDIMQREGGYQYKLTEGADQFQSFIFEAMAAEEPELYKRVKKFVKSKQKVG